MPDDMVERVAKAIEAAGETITIESGGAFASIFAYIQDEDIQVLARAAIEAMREPTGAMLTAMRVNLGGTDQLHIDEAEEAWRKGIDAALNYPSVTRDGKNVDL